MLAAFIAMLWLMPFNTISMTVSLPFDAHFDRVVLPFIVLVWALSLAVGGRGAPRLRFTPIHAAVGIYVALAFLSVVINTSSLNQTLQYDTSIKKLTLLLSYVTFFVVLASVVRRTEVAAFLKYTLLLAVLCAIGTLWEHRSHYNVFYDLWGKLLPGLFRVQQSNNAGFDAIGRPVVTGPSELGLEVAAMLAMAVPVALVGLMHARRRRDQILYGLAGCLILAGGLSTYRKTSLIAPGVVILALACFRPRESLRLAPLAVVLVLVIHVLAPGAIGGVVQQLQGSRLASVSTTEHRTAAYEAIRPLVWSHPLLGQGYGGYNAYLNRILDSQFLSSAIEVGVIGLAAYLVMIISVVVTAAPMIRARSQWRAPPALAAGVAAIAFFTVSFLYDAMEFPHGPYIFLTFAAFVAVLVKPPEAT